MNEQQAQRILQAAVTKAKELDIRVCIAVVDASAQLNMFQRMDGAFLGAIDVAIKKARTSALFPLPSGDFGQLMRDEDLTGMHETNGGLIGFPGGCPVFVAGQSLGAIGISGGSADQDHAIASAAAVMEAV
ncbi:GlcG/HbpS family heme-binding protein [Pontibacter sp. JAM-7]|uniref:GlcG/HbpS family heme-binding protein n=1 Tax=Pontibacter sp. JAM-7 TaxID=3366581 RepID=UPI003AF540A6